jgi:hypothetical protein
MSPARKLIGFLLLLCLVAYVTYTGVRRHLMSKYSPQQTGLEWMRAEYQLSDATFEQVKRLHEQYFADCEAMSMKISEVNRHLLYARGRVRVSPETKQMLLQQDQALCAKFEEVTLQHLKNVAALLPPEQAQRFLDEFTADVHQQRIEHQRTLSDKVRK